MVARDGTRKTVQLEWDNAKKRRMRENAGLRGHPKVKS